MIIGYRDNFYLKTKQKIYIHILIHLPWFNITVVVLMPKVALNLNYISNIKIVS